jgi:hypothetical protein
MPRDIAFTESRGIETDATGDLRTVTGAENALQQILLTAWEDIQSIRGSLTGTTLAAEVEANLRAGLRASEYVSAVTALSVETVGPQEVRVNIQTESDAISRRVGV